MFGFLFGVALVRFRTLWLPFGIHCGWNCALAGAGAKLSGLKVRLMEMEIVETGPTFWTGGAYGPEGSPITTIFVAIDRKLAGAICLTDEAHQESSEAVRKFLDLGLEA